MLLKFLMWLFPNPFIYSCKCKKVSKNKRKIKNSYINPFDKQKRKRFKNGKI